MEGESIMGVWLQIALFGFIILYIVYLNSKLTKLMKGQHIGAVIISALEGRNGNEEVK